MIELVAALAGALAVWWAWRVPRGERVLSEGALDLLARQVLDDEPTLPVTQEERIVAMMAAVEGLEEVSYGPTYRLVVRDGRKYRVYPDGRHQLAEPSPVRKMRRIG